MEKAFIPDDKWDRATLQELVNRLSLLGALWEAEDAVLDEDPDWSQGFRDGVAMTREVLTELIDGRLAK